MNRTTFETNRALEFFSEKELSMQLGHYRGRWLLAIIKELIDNSLDACETKGGKPEISVEVSDESLTVTDTGPGLSEEVLKKSLDYMIRVSDKNNYISPSRGQLGNALKCVWAAPFVLSGHSFIEVFTNGKRYEIEVRVDEIKQAPLINFTVSDDSFVKNGCSIKIHSPELASLLVTENDYRDDPVDDFFKLIDGYGLFNPGAGIKAHLPGYEMYDPTTEADLIKKWAPTDPTSPYWYDPGP